MGMGFIQSSKALIMYFMFSMLLAGLAEALDSFRNLHEEIKKAVYL